MIRDGLQLHQCYYFCRAHCLTEAPPTKLSSPADTQRAFDQVHTPHESKYSDTSYLAISAVGSAVPANTSRHQSYSQSRCPHQPTQSKGLQPSSLTSNPPLVLFTLSPRPTQTS